MAGAYSNKLTHKDHTPAVEPTGPGDGQQELWKVINLVLSKLDALLMGQVGIVQEIKELKSKRSEVNEHDPW